MTEKMSVVSGDAFRVVRRQPNIGAKEPWHARVQIRHCDIQSVLGSIWISKVLGQRLRPPNHFIPGPGRIIPISRRVRHARLIEVVTIEEDE